MLGQVSSLVRVDSAWRRLTPSLEVECASLCRSFVFFGSQDSHISLPDLLRTKKRRGADQQTPASQYCRGLQVQRFTHGKPELPGAAVSDKFFIPYHAFSYGLRYAKPRFFLKLPCSPNSRP